MDTRDHSTYSQLFAQDGELTFAQARIELEETVEEDPVSDVALLGGRCAGPDVGAVRGLRLRDGQAVLGAGDRLGRARRLRTPPERDGQRREPENPQVRKPGPAPSECHAKAEYSILPLGRG